MLRRRALLRARFGAELEQDEGIDLDEEGNVNIGAWLTRVVAVSNPSGVVVIGG